MARQTERSVFPEANSEVPTNLVEVPEGARFEGEREAFGLTVWEGEVPEEDLEA